MNYKYLAGLTLTVLLASPAAVSAAVEPTIAEGITARGIDLGGMTHENACLAIDDYFNTIEASTFRLTCCDGTVEEIPVSDWDFYWDSEHAVTQAMKFGNSGSLISRYKYRSDIKANGLELDVPYEINPKTLTTSLTRLASSHDHPATNASIDHSDTVFRVSSSEADGVVTDITATKIALMDLFASNLSTNMSFEVITKTDIPTVTTDLVEYIQDRLGSFTTYYSDSTENRKVNVEVATANINGTVLVPGETLSVSEAMKPRTEENGYKVAAQYSNGESEQDIGGGVCQVSTTLYNALLLAELEIEERHPHSMIVQYAEYGADAAIASGSKDLTFTNNLDYPIYIEGITDGDMLQFNIYGTDERPENRTIEYISETTYFQWPQDRNIKYSDEYPAGSVTITGTLRPEVTATLTKVVYEDGVETDRTLLHTDYYAASKQTEVHGTGQ